MGVDIGVKIRATTKEGLAAKRCSVLGLIDASPVKANVWQVGQEKLEEVIVKKAAEKKASYGFAESCTGGLLSHRITAVPGSSQNFFGSVVSYDSSVKVKLLDVPAATIDRFGVVSTETAEAMAQGLAKRLGTSIAVSTTGIAGPSGGTEETPVGTVCIGVHVNGKTTSIRYQFRGDRALLKERFSEAALMALLDALETFA
jgi:nicotinamide-nucleotide amidase